jgi:glycerophosphoryl diester phosphodiesterase
MRIIAHRGAWDEVLEQNSPEAVRRALELGFDVEVDLRRQGDSLVLQHDATHRSFRFDSDALSEFDNSFFWLNVKEDGLGDLLLGALGGVRNYALFDASVPETRMLAAAGLNCAVRASDLAAGYETSPLAHTVGPLWLDDFAGNIWWDSALAGYLDRHSMIGIVSPDLHRRPHDLCWRAVEHLQTDTHVGICTDLLKAASEYWRDKHTND